MTTKTCENCGYEWPVITMVCDNCGYCFYDAVVRSAGQIRKNEYVPNYPKTLEEAIAFLQNIHNDEKINVDGKGLANIYRFGLRVGINTMIHVLKQQGK